MSIFDVGVFILCPQISLMKVNTEKTGRLEQRMKPSGVGTCSDLSLLLLLLLM